MDLAGADREGRAEPWGPRREDGSGDADALKHEQETRSGVRMRKIHTFLPRQMGVCTDPQQRVFSPEKECRVNVLQLAGLIFCALRVWMGRATWIMLSACVTPPRKDAGGRERRQA